MGTKVSKSIGCESFSAPPSDTAGITEVIGAEEVDFEEDSTGILYHLQLCEISTIVLSKESIYLTAELY